MRRRLASFNFRNSRAVKLATVVMLAGLFLWVLFTVAISARVLHHTNALEFNSSNARQLMRWNNWRSMENSTTCRNTLQGNRYVADDKGYICHRKDLNATTGCCTTNSNSQRFYCNTCDLETSCCVLFEICVSCCMGSEKNPLEEVIRSSPTYSLVDNDFDLCKIICRTSSKSVVHENAYRSEWKHCFGISIPPLKP